MGNTYDPYFGSLEQDNTPKSGYEDMPYFYGQRWVNNQAKIGAMGGTESAGMSGAGTATAASAPFLTTPMGAGVLVGSQLAMQMAAQSAADDRARREKLASIAMQHGEQEQQGLKQLTDVYRSALR